MSDGSPLARTIAAGKLPATRRSLAAELTALGVRAGDLLIVHAAMAPLGYVVGGAESVVAAFLDAVGPEGTLVMPAHASDRSDPAAWCNPPVPREWWDVIREHMPAFDPATCQAQRMGAVADAFRAWPGAVRSPHPSCSFVARGPLAAEIVRDHPLSPGLGETSPLGRIYERSGSVLLLGVSHANDSSLHLAECRARGIRLGRVRTGAALVVDGVRRWIGYDDHDYDSDDFEALGDAFARETGRERRGAVGLAEARLCEQREVVDFGVRWLEAHRPGP